MPATVWDDLAWLMATGAVTFAVTLAVRSLGQYSERRERALYAAQRDLQMVERRAAQVLAEVLRWEEERRRLEERESA